MLHGPVVHQLLALAAGHFPCRGHVVWFGQLSSARTDMEASHSCFHVPYRVAPIGRHVSHVRKEAAFLAVCPLSFIFLSVHLLFGWILGFELFEGFGSR